MATIVTRSGKGSPLTNTEVDANFTNLNTDKIETNAEVRAAVEAASDSNVFTDADHTKLNAIEASATADQTAAEILTAIKTVDGTGSGLDADTLDGVEAAALMPLSGGTFTGGVAVTGYLSATTAMTVQNGSGTEGVQLLYNENGGEIALYGTSGNTKLLIDYLDSDNDGNGLGRILNLGAGNTGLNIGIANASNTGGIALGTGNNVTRQFISNIGDIYNYQTDGSTVGMTWKADNKRLGIGTSSPDLKLDVSHNVSSEYVATFQNIADNLELKIGTTSGLLNIQGANASTNAAYDIALNAEGGNVGIGTSSPSSSDKLSVVGGNIKVSKSIAQSGNSLDNSTFSAIVINNSNDANGDLAGIAMYPTSQYTAAAGLFGVRESQTAAGLSFWTGSNTGAQRMLLTSAGDLLVGTTDTTLYNNTTGTGTKIGGDGRLDVSRSADTVATFNRTGSSDGEIIRVVRSGTTIGAIGSNGNTLFIENGDTGLRFEGDNNRILPSGTNGGNRNSITDLGEPNCTFKDGYFSGVAVTGAATVGGASVKVAGKESIYVPAAAMYPSTTNPCSDLTQVETTALSPDLKVLDFAAAADDFAQFTIAFPKSWNEGTVTFQPFWTVTGTDAGTVAWQLAAVAITSDESINTAFGTQVATTALAFSTTSNDLMVSAESGAVTIAGSPAANDMCFFQINRHTGADNQSGAARLIGIKIFFTTDAANDA